MLKNERETIAHATFPSVLPFAAEQAMPDEPPPSFKELTAYANTPVPAVDPADLRVIYNYHTKLSETRTGGISLGQSVYERLCSRGANSFDSVVSVRDVDVDRADARPGYPGVGAAKHPAGRAIAVPQCP